MEEIKKDKNKFYIGEDSEKVIAEITFTLEDKNKIVIDHTFVSESLKGQGVGAQLVNKVVELARQENKKIVPLCSFAEKVLTKTNEYRDVLLDM